ncbi:hypothetical protein O181_057586 [Austropuccinia psidii MF-1]|uniref:Uncharacterized protein n=1 Tax=Austropuccinia psidii MF-1 TaxID=1389203 RepID=A0A9Q3HU23_9BASI|nr:hypothetical protein [Austropuccinia psidii MF-1]
MDQQSTSKLPPLPEDTVEETDHRIHNIPRRAFVSIPNNPSPLQQKKLEKVMKKVERIAQIEGETDEDLEIKIAFWTKNPRISNDIVAIPGYEEGNWTQLNKSIAAKWGRVEAEIRYREDCLIQLFNDTQEGGGISTLSEYKKFI